MLVHRLGTAAFLVFGLFLYFVLIPNHVETISYGWLRPGTLPNALAILLIVFAFLQMFTPPNDTEELPTLPEFVRAVLFIIGVIACVYAMGQFGFLPVSIVMALILMLVVGERRPHWLALGGAVIPVSVWYTTEVFLGRPLP